MPVKSSSVAFSSASRPSRSLARSPSVAPPSSADSRALLRHVYGLAFAAGWEIGNVDATVLAQAPKIAPHVPAMRANLASDLNCDETRVSVKATTTERLGFTGREEGIGALATVLLQLRDRNAGP